MIRYILLVLGVYVVYKLVFDLVIPVFRASRQVHQQFRNMQDNMRQQANTSQNAQTTQREQGKTSRPQKPTPGDYIDFEEIK
jgi:hypothetical protein